MRHMNRTWLSVWGAAAALASLAWGSPSAAPADLVSSQWQRHTVKFNYVGFTTLYTCDGLESQVRQILLHLGARKDIKVTAAGCPGPFDTPSHTAWVNADFYTLAPAVDASESERVQARWTPLSVTPGRPSFMRDGDCELIEEMKPLISQNFALRTVDYRTDCYPHEITLNGFSVKGQALRPLPEKANSEKG
jgi:hypothetical protein